MKCLKPTKEKDQWTSFPPPNRSRVVSCLRPKSDRGPEGRRAARIIYEALFRAAEDREDRERVAGNISGYLFGSPTLVEWFKRTYPDEAQVIEDAICQN